jgi:hypothetical protein
VRPAIENGEQFLADFNASGRLCVPITSSGLITQRRPREKLT